MCRKKNKFLFMERVMDVLSIKRYAKRTESEVASVECTIYLKRGIIWFCPDPFNKEEMTRLERELDRGEWSGKEIRWITQEQYLLWSFQR